MNLKIAIYNAQMQTINEAKFKGAQMIIEQENLESELKGEKRIPESLRRKSKWPVVWKAKLWTKRNPFKIPIMEERAILDWLENARTTKSRSGLRTNAA